jgi:hypothetical protein
MTGIEPPDQIALLRLRGSLAGKGTMEEYFTRHHAEKERELAQEAREREERKQWRQ